VTSLAHDRPELAETYDRLSDWQFEGGKRLVERLAPKVGDRVLDVGCGTGRLTRWIAEITGRDCVRGIDPLVDRVAVARARAPGLSFEVGRAEDLSAFANDSFDAVCMSAVFHWVGDRPKALAEVRRVLRPGGRLGMTTLPRELRLASSTALVCEPLLRRKPYSERVVLSELAVGWQGSTLTELVAMLLEAGLGLLELHLVRRIRIHSTGEEIVDFLESSSFGNFLRLVPEDLRASFRTEVAAAFEAKKGPEGISMYDYGTVIVAERSA
jgi:arsenite methyltransferase